MIAFLSGYPELNHKSGTTTMFQLFYLCLQHVVLAVPDVKFGLSIGIGDGSDLCEVIRPVQRYMLSNCPEYNKFTEAASVNKSLEVLEESFGGTVVEPGSSPCVYVDCFDKDTISKELVTI